LLSYALCLKQFETILLHLSASMHNLRKLKHAYYILTATGTGNVAIHWLATQVAKLLWYIATHIR